jgi:Family of unknown function (DUF6328)
MPESAKERTDRQLIELLNELRVALPGAQVLLAFLLVVPFSNRFHTVDGAEKVALFVALLATVAGTLLLMAPSVYHRLRWGEGGKSDVILVGNRFFLLGTALLAIGIAAVVFLVASVVYGAAVAIVTTCVVAATVVCTWYVYPLRRSSRQDVREQE